MLLPLLVLGSCDFFQRDSRTEDPVLARVGDKYLYASDVADLLKAAQTAADSAEMTGRFVDDWVKRQLILIKAETYLPSEAEMDIDKRVRDYRESLLVYAYENELIMQKMDTIVSPDEIAQYYVDHEESFELIEDIVQFYYLKIPREAPKLDEARDLFRLDQEEDKQRLVEYGFKYAEDFYLKDSIWYELNLLYSEIPIDLRQLKTMALNRLSGEVEDSSYVYLLKINDYIPQREQAPLAYVEDNIRNIILNRRKQKLINATYDNLYKDGLKNGSFEKYEP